jgi:RNA polymerase sigma factor (sigma-70 family)
VGPNRKQAFVADLEKQHGSKLRRFFARRMRHRKIDEADLVQEVFLRLLRIDHHETIRSPEAYLYTIAFHVLHQHALREAATPDAVEVTALIDEMDTSPAADPATQAEVRQRLDDLQLVIARLSPKARAVLLLHRRDGYSLEEIAAQLGISRAMAAKYLGRALLQCRQLLGNGQ